MGGFKHGTADDDWGSTADEAESTAESEPETGDTESTAEPPTNNKQNTTIRSTSESVTQSSRRNLPWVLTRNSITDGRDQTVQLHLQQSTVSTQREAIRTLEANLGEQVKKADLREAALLVGLQHTDEIATTLREWGYDLE